MLIIYNILCFVNLVISSGTNTKSLQQIVHTNWFIILIYSVGLCKRATYHDALSCIFYLRINSSDLVLYSNVIKGFMHNWLDKQSWRCNNKWSNNYTHRTETLKWWNVLWLLNVGVTYSLLLLHEDLSFKICLFFLKTNITWSLWLYRPNI